MVERPSLKTESSRPPLSPEEEKRADTAVKQEIAKNYKDSNIETFFGVARGQLSRKEIKEVRAYATYALREILRATIISPINADQCKGGKDRVSCAVELVLKVSFHELCHTFGSYENDGRVVPEFLLVENQSYDEKLLRDEVHTFTYWPEYEQVPLYLTLTDPTLTERWISKFVQRYGREPVKERRDRVTALANKMRAVDRTSFEAVFDLTQEVVLLMFEIVTAELIRSSDGVDRDGEFGQIVGNIKQFSEEIKHGTAQPALARRILKTPDPTNKAHARKIFNAYTKGDKKAVFNEAIGIMRKAIKNERLKV